MVPKAVGYIRVSTQAQAKEGESLDTQRKQIEAHAAAKGWELLRIYADEGISGANAETRPQFQQLMKGSESNGSFQYVITTKLSRFARNTSDFLTYRDKLKAHGVEFISIHENIDSSTHTGKLMLTLIAAIAEWERKSIEETMSSNKMSRWKDNRTFIGQPPFGYRWNKETKKLEIDEAEAATYRRIVKMYTERGQSYRDIQVQLKKEDIRCKRAFFSNTSISYMLKNPAYYGHYVLNTRAYDYRRGEHGEQISDKRIRTKELKPKHENITFPIPALISKTEWDSIQEHTEFNKIKGKRTTWSADFWLRDIVYCQHCGGKMRAHKGSTRADGTFPRYYTCYWASTSVKNLQAAGREKCDLPYIKADSLEHMIWTRLLLLLRHPYHRSRSVEPLADLPEQYQAQIKTLQTELDTLAKQQRKVENARKRLFDLYEDDSIDKSELAERLSANKQLQLDIEAKAGEATTRLDALREAMENDKAVAEFVRDKAGAIDRMLEEMRRLAPADKKRVIESVVPGPVMVDWDPEPDDDGNVSGIGYGAKFRFNQEIFQWLLEERKISPVDPEPAKAKDGKYSKKIKGKAGEQLGKNGPDHPAVSDLCGSAGNV